MTEKLYISHIDFPKNNNGMENANETKIYLSNGCELRGITSASVIAECNDALKFSLSGYILGK